MIDRIETEEFARAMRREPTDAEHRLWARLRRRQLDGRRFRRQVVLGQFIVDFACFDEMLVVEVDGGQHATNEAADRRRSAWLRSQGFRVLRFWNDQVPRNTDAVVEQIRLALAAGRTD